jgi:hypothetical protein
MKSRTACSSVSGLCNVFKAHLCCSVTQYLLSFLARQYFRPHWTVGKPKFVHVKWLWMSRQPARMELGFQGLFASCQLPYRSRVWVIVLIAIHWTLPGRAGMELDVLEATHLKFRHSHLQLGSSHSHHRTVAFLCCQLPVVHLCFRWPGWTLQSS